MSSYIAQLKEDWQNNTNANKSQMVGLGGLIATGVVCKKKYKCDWGETILFSILNNNVITGITNAVIGFDNDKNKDRVITGLAASGVALGTVVLCRKKYKYGWLKTCLFGALGYYIPGNIASKTLEILNNKKEDNSK